MEVASEYGYNAEITEWDIVRGASHDLTVQPPWDEICSKIDASAYDIIFISPPCNTFSRSLLHMWVPGPLPLRTAQHTKCVPWLSGVRADKVHDPNFMILQTLRACECASRVGALYAIGHPEDLGDYSGYHPASIWQWAEVQDLASKTKSIRIAFHQKTFGADSPKPTAVLTNCQDPAPFLP